MGMVFNNFLHLPDLWVSSFCQNSFIGELFDIPGFKGIVLRNFSGFMGGTFTI